jgi:primosomal protein N'
MKAKDIKHGGLYTARVNGKLVTVRVNKIRSATTGYGRTQREVARYDVTNLSTGRKTTFRSAMKFRSKKELASDAKQSREKSQEAAKQPSDPLEMETRRPTESTIPSGMSGKADSGTYGERQQKLADQLKVHKDTGVDNAPHLLIEARAGTGKTTSLVSRMIELLASGRCAIDKMAAITFTWKASAELRSRFLLALEQAARHAYGERARVLMAASDHVEQCCIGTIHSFCARLLRERPVEADVEIGFHGSCNNNSGCFTYFP